jgi:hypothetical protein
MGRGLGLNQTGQQRKAGRENETNELSFHKS